MIYDINGNLLHDSFSDSMELDYAYDSATGANYSVIRVFQTKQDGTKQYPFVRCPGMMAISDFAASEDWGLIINSGLGWDGAIDGVAIENGVVINGNPASYHAGSIPLTIDANGNLATAAVNATGSSLVANGIVSAICGFCAIIENYAAVQSFPTVSHVSHFTENA